MKLSFILIDENLNQRETIRQLLQNENQAKLLGDFKSTSSAQDFLDKTTVDFILIDPNFSSELGFNWVEKKCDLHNIIILSGRTKDAVKAFEVGVFDFILKPFNLKQFKRSLSRLNNTYYIQQKRASILEPNYIEVRCDFMTERIEHENIKYVEAMGDYVKIVTEKRKFVVLMSMKKIEELLPKKFFFRTHKSFIVNIKKVDNFSFKEVVLGKNTIPLSRLRKHEFRKLMFDF